MGKNGLGSFDREPENSRILRVAGSISRVNLPETFEKIRASSGLFGVKGGISELLKDFIPEDSSGVKYQVPGRFVEKKSVVVLPFNKAEDDEVLSSIL